MARLWSSRVRAEKRSVGMSGALLMAMRALVLAGLPVTVTRTSSAATSLRALPCGAKMPPLASSRSPRSMPGPRGRAPTSRARLTPSKTVRRVVADLDLGERREGAVVELHDDALESLEGGRDLEEAQLDRGVGAEQGAARDAEEEAVADLACGAGDGDLDGGCAHGKRPFTSVCRWTLRRYQWARARPARLLRLGHELPGWSGREGEGGEGDEPADEAADEEVLGHVVDAGRPTGVAAGRRLRAAAWISGKRSRPLAAMTMPAAPNSPARPRPRMTSRSIGPSSRPPLRRSAGWPRRGRRAVGGKVGAAAATGRDAGPRWPAGRGAR